MRYGGVPHSLTSAAGAWARRQESDAEYLRIYDPAVTASPKKGSVVQYAHRLSAGMKAKKYKGGKAAAIKASTRRVFDQYFKPLPTP